MLKELSLYVENKGNKYVHSVPDWIVSLLTPYVEALTPTVAVFEDGL